MVTVLCMYVAVSHENKWNVAVTINKYDIVIDRWIGTLICC